MKRHLQAATMLAAIMFGVFIVEPILAQQQQSGGGGSSVSLSAPIPAGTALIGKVGIDQTTPGTTNKVDIGTNGTVAATQSGTYTVQPGNTANTTPWFIKMIPLHTCAGNTADDVTTVDVATSTGSAVTAVDTCVFQIYLNNKTASPVTVTIQDKSGTPIVYSTTFSIPGNSDDNRAFGGHKFLGGVQLIAGTSSAINAVTTGVH